MTFAEAVQKEVGPHNSVPIDEIGAGMRIAVLIVNAVFVDRLAPLVRKKQIADIFRVREFLQFVNRIVADGDQLRTCSFNRF